MKPLLVEEQSRTHLAVTPQRLITSTNPAVARLAAAVEQRDSADPVANYSRMHHRHARSHTRK